MLFEARRRVRCAYLYFLIWRRIAIRTAVRRAVSREAAFGCRITGDVDTQRILLLDEILVVAIAYDAEYRRDAEHEKIPWTTHE